MIKKDLVGRPMEILLVEDSLSDARLAMHALTKGKVQHRLTLVTTGEEAIEFLTRARRFQHAPRPDLVLLDLHLPKIDGFEVLNYIKSDDELRATPVVIMTSSQQEANRFRCEELEVDSYVTKPVDMPQFLTLVRELRRFWHEDVILPTTIAS